MKGLMEWILFNLTTFSNCTILTVYLQEASNVVDVKSWPLTLDTDDLPKRKLASIYRAPTAEMIAYLDFRYVLSLMRQRWELQFILMGSKKIELVYFFIAFPQLECWQVSRCHIQRLPLCAVP